MESACFFQVVAELVVSEAECRRGSALVEMVRRQCVAEQLLLVGRDAAEEIAGCRGLGGEKRSRASCRLRRPMR